MRRNVACATTMDARPSTLTACPDAKVPMMNAADPAPRTQPYSKPTQETPRGLAAANANASAKTVVGASIAACRRLIASNKKNQWVVTKASATNPAVAAQIASTSRHARSRSAIRPAIGPETRRIVVAKDRTSPSCSGVTPRDERNAGKNGDATPKPK